MFATVVVDPPVDAREAGRDLVDGAVQVVDPALERDRELDEVLAAAADQRRAARRAAAGRAPRRPQARTSPASRSDDADDGDESGDVPRDVHGATDGSEKMTLYCGRVVRLRSSRPAPPRRRPRPSSGEANGTWPRSLKVTVASVARVDQLHLLRLRDRAALRAGRSIVSVTGICTSCESPPLWIVTWKTRLELVVTVFSVPGAAAPRGAAGAVRERGDRDDVRAVQAGRRAAGRGAARSAARIERHRVRGDRSGPGSARKCDSGTVDAGDAVLPASTRHRRRLEEVVPDDVAREQPVRLLGEQRARLDASACRLRAGRSAGSRRRGPLTPLTRSCERLDQVPVLDRGASRAGESPCAGVDVLLLLRRRCCGASATICCSRQPRRRQRGHASPCRWSSTGSRSCSTSSM